MISWCYVTVVITNEHITVSMHEFLETRYKTQIQNIVVLREDNDFDYELRMVEGQGHKKVQPGSCFHITK